MEQPRQQDRGNQNRQDRPGLITIITFRPKDGDTFGYQRHKTKLQTLGLKYQKEEEEI